MSKLLIDDSSLTAIADGFRASRKITEKLALDRMATLAAESVSGGLDVAITEYNQMNSQVVAYLDAAKAYTDTDNQSSTVMSNFLSTTEYDDPLGQSINITANGTLYMVDETTGINTSESVTAGSKTIYNLIPDHVYQWFVKSASGEVIASGRLKPTGYLRMIKFIYDGIRNFRDIGGWACDGGTIKYGRLIRGGFAGNSEIDTENKKLVKYVGIKHDIDLRNEASLLASPLGTEVHYSNYPIEAYYKSIIDGSDPVSYNNAVKALRAIMDAVNHDETCYFHCSLGADRCGTIAWMIESLLGMSSADKDKDYELTTFYVYQKQSETRYRTRTDYKALYTYIGSLEGDTFIDKVVKWYLYAGFSIDELNTFRKSAIDGNPPVLTAPIETFSVTNTLTHCSTNNSATSAVEGNTYSATITANSGYELDSVIVIMGGVDITSTAVSGGKITITSVTGDIVITAVAVEQGPSYTNVLKEVGYESGRLGSTGNDATASGYVRTKYIPCKTGDVIRIANVTGLNASDSDASNHRFSFYDSSKTHLRTLNCTSTALGSTTSASGTYYNLVYDSSGNIIQFTIPQQDNSANLSTVAFLRFCTASGGITDNSIVTINEEIV